jgi:hypothetical protein
MQSVTRRRESFLNHPLKHALLWLGTLAVLGTAPSAHAGDNDESGFSLRGFGTLGIARSSSDHAEFIRDLSQPGGIKNRWSGRIDSLLGVQAEWQATPTLEFVGQVVTRWHYDRSRDPEVMWAFAKWEPDARVSLRAGRIGADFMMLADSRLVGYSYLPVRPSSDFFGPLFFSHFDGVDASVTLPLGNGLVRGKLFAGETQEKTSGAPGIWDTSGSPVRGIVLDYQTGPWLLRANMASIRFSSDVNFTSLTGPLRLIGAPSTLAAADALITKNTTTRFTSLGVVYDEGPLQVQGMVNRIHHESGVFQNSEAGYLLAGYRLGTITPYAGVSRWLSHYKDYTTGLPSGVGFDALIAGFDRVMNASTSNQTTYTLGARWDVYQNTALKLQWDAIRGKASSRFPFAVSDANWNGKADVLSLSLDFIF